MAQVRFTVTREIALPADQVFAELIDWKAHEDWVPLTTVVIHSGDGGVGTEFTATSGIRPLALPDRMRIDSLDAEAMTVMEARRANLFVNVMRKACQRSVTRQRASSPSS